MSKAHAEAVAFTVFAAIALTVTVRARKDYTWWVPAALGFAVSVVVVCFNLRGYVFGGPGFTIHRPGDR